MKNIFIVINVDWFFLSHRKDIAIAAKKAGYNVTIVTKNTGKKEEILKLGLKVIDLPLNRSGKNIFHEMETFRFLYSLYKKRKPDIVHHVGLKIILWGTLAAKLSKTKGVVNAVSGLGVFFSVDSKSLMAPLILSILKYSHKQKNMNVIFQNNEDKTFFLKNNIIKDSQTVIIKGSGVDLQEYCYTEEPREGKIIILLTARMIIEKGIFVLIEAALKLKPVYRNKIKFLICGGIDDNPRAIKESELKNVCDGEYIQWLGHRTDIPEILKSAHIMAFPSYYKEGLPKSLIEAAAIGRPIITTDSIGCRETVENGKNGYLIPIKDSKTLADKIKELVENKELRMQMGRQSRKLAEENFSIEKVIHTHLDIYNKLSQN